VGPIATPNPSTAACKASTQVSKRGLHLSGRSTRGRALREKILPVVSHEETDDVHCGPGPFWMAGADMVSTLLRGSGFERIAFERFDADICVGRGFDDAIEFAMALGPAGEIIRLAGDAGQQRKPEVIAGLGETLARYDRGAGVWGPSSAWFVSARNPV
jgi:hypothetical protein